MLTFSLSSSALCGALIVFSLGTGVALGEMWSLDCSFVFRSDSELSLLSLTEAICVSSGLTVKSGSDDASSTSFLLPVEELGSLEESSGVIVLLVAGSLEVTVSCVAVVDGWVFVGLGSSAAMSSHESTSPPPTGTVKIII